MYPLNMQHPAGGFALANDEAEHRALSAADYAPKWQDDKAEAKVEDKADQAEETIEDVRAKLDAASIAYDKRWGIERLRSLLVKEA